MCPLGESRVYTDAKVTNKHAFLYKSRIDAYDEAHHPYAKFNPGFRLLPLCGGDLLVLGVLVEILRQNSP